MSSNGRHQLMELLNNLKIETRVVEHPAVFTVDAMMDYLKDVDGFVTKNLFLKDKKNKLWLLCTSHSSQIKLSDVAKLVGAAGTLRFADEKIMIEKLGVAQGSCTPLSLCNDKNNDVKLILDQHLLRDGSWIYSHPLENTATLGMSVENFKMFLKETGHEPEVINVN
ncbi:prolyl-tRNA synthetase associated domain-containing protein 1 isoform X2 [Hydra vulgaris]|uniref:PrdX deacylase domain-containing protein 1 n=1 Tax=Hydra vulgaris TaxID=6087 RepID=A0ABM4DPT6_HYDVU